jgi:hypothetical protein
MAGSSYADFVIVDAVVAPAEARGWFSESRVFLPHTYQANYFDVVDGVRVVRACERVER